LLYHKSATACNSLWHDACSMVLPVVFTHTAVQTVVLTVCMFAEDCDEDVQQYCQQALTAPRAGVWGIGTAGRCLSKSLAEGQYMAQGCKNLVIAAAPKASCCPQPAWF